MRLTPWERSSFSPICIKVGLKAVHLLQMKNVQGRMVVSGSESASFSGSADDCDSEVAGAIQACLAGGAFKGRTVILCLCGDDVLVHHQRVMVDSDEAGRGAMEKRLHQEMRLSVNCDMDSAYTRFLKVGTVKERSEQKEELILVVVKREVVDRYLKILESCKLIPSGIRVEPFALHNAFRCFCPEEMVRGPANALINLGESKTDVIISNEGRPVFVRSLPLGVEKFTKAIARKMNIDRDGMGRIVGALGKGPRVNEIVKQAVLSAVRPDLEYLCSEIMTCFRYFYTTFNGENIGSLIIPDSAAANLLNIGFLQERIGIPVHLWNSGFPDREGGDGEGVNFVEADFAALTGIAAGELDGAMPPIDFLPEGVAEARNRGRINKIRAACLGTAFLLIGTFYCKSEQRQTVLSDLQQMCMQRAEVIQGNSKRVELLTGDLVKLHKEREELSGAVCPFLLSRVLAEIAQASPQEVSITKISTEFSYHNKVILVGKRKKTVQDLSKPVLNVTVEGHAEDDGEVSTFVERLRATGAFPDIDDLGSWNVRGKESTLKEFTLKLVVGGIEEL